MPKDGVWVGQRVHLAITLSTPDLFAGVPLFEMPPIPGVVVLPPAGSPTIGSFSRRLAELGDAAYGRPGGAGGGAPWDDLVGRVAAARRKPTEGVEVAPSTLPPLNPSR